MLKARQAAEIEPQLLILSSKGILRGPIRPFETRSIRMLNDGSDVGDGCRVGARSNRGAGLSRPRFGFSIATARIDLDVLARGISIVTSALRQIVTRPRGGLGPGDRADRATGNGADRSTDRPTGDQPPEQSTDDGAADRARGGIGWRRWRWRWRVRHWRRIADPRRGSIIGPRVVVHHLEIRDIGWRPFHRLRVEIQDAADIPVPSIAPVVHLV